MRLHNLNLVRFGKFTDTDIALPAAEHDFHLIVGPNEAGKSTVRSAIADLLFGFPRQYAAMAFLHQQPELRLAAKVSEGDRQLDFVRTKGNRNTLRNPADAPLPDDALGEYLGSADRTFFETMLGLSHEQLVAGGKLVLDASEDVSQVLFQSAAGIAGLGTVKDGLLNEADKLWAQRHSGSRAYYIASDQFELATKDLKSATARTKNWADARTALDAVDEQVAAATEKNAGLQVTRQRLERVRRLAPKVVELKQKLAELQALGEVLVLPANAQETLTDGEQELSVAETTLSQWKLAVERLAAQRDEAVFDAGILAAKDDIEGLAAYGERVRQHDADLLKHQGDVDRSLALARAAAAELGWPADADDGALRARLPAQLTLREVQRLAKEHGGLLQTNRSAAQSVEDKKEELDGADEELKGMQVFAVSPALRSALAEARVHRNTAADQAKLQTAVTSAERALEKALAALGDGRREVDLLLKMSVPSTAHLTALVAKRQGLDAELNNAADRADDAQQALDEANLAVKHLAEAGHIVTGVDVRKAREKRDAEWRSIKDGTTQLATSAAGLDAAIDLADELVDTQLGSATEAANLQSLRQTAERAEAALRTAAQTKERKNSELDAFDEEWRTAATALGLPGLALADAQAWMSKRELAIAAVSTLGEKEDALKQQMDASRPAVTELVAQLAQAGTLLAPESPLPAILAQAEELVTTADAATARRAEVVKQRDNATAAVSRLQGIADTANAAFEAWELKWNAAVSAAGLSDYVKSVEDAEQALAKVEAVKQNLDKAASTKRDRVDIMTGELAEFTKLADGVVTALGIAELMGKDARDVVRALSSKRKEAEAGQTRRAAADEALRSAEEQRDHAGKQVEKVKAKVAPLLAAAGVETLADAAPLVARHEAKRKLDREVESAREALTQGSDGLGLDAVVAEVEGCDLDQVTIDLTKTTAGIEQVQAEQTRLATERLQAQQVLDAFGGGGAAANAESRRQEALAAMADASERYIRVTTAAKLLTWAIDRYRERNQGPMLSRAGAIFAGLTLGRYTKLFVDFESTPFRLSALRTDGQAVEVPGMSEGTRDQLYLALRLAALEIHLEKAKALPFVADDLFINFDDARSTAGLEALRDLSKQTQVLFLSHHDHLLPMVQKVFGADVNVVRLER